MGLHPTQTIRIKRREPRSLYFVIEDRAGRQIATSGRFETICRLELGLAVLVQASQKRHLVVIARDDQSTSIRVGSSRKRVRFVSDLTGVCVRDLLAGINSAEVIDERAASQRRTELSGRLCELDL
jgi:hypothetical protein